MEKISEWLREEEVSIIGVWGMAGVGKTTLLKHIHNQILEGFNGLSFDHVFWVPVPPDCSTRRMQEIIAKKIDLNISNEDDETEIATMLSHGFQRINKCLLILDNVWDHILLENVGIPLTNNGVKMILTTRSFEVCQIMGCEKNIALEPICDEEAWVLFLKNLGSHASLPSEVMEIARSIAKECTGLPLAICSVARSMKGKDEISEWRYLFEKLRSSMMGQEDMKKWVFPALRSSYDHLNDGKLQQCFLYCALYPEREWIERDKLIRNFIDEGFIDGMKSFKSQFDEGHVILKKLKNNTLLLKKVQELHNFAADMFSDIPKDVHSFSLQKLVWCMAVTIAEESHRYMAKGGQHLTEIPHERNWTEDLEKVSLIRNDIKEIPSGTSPRCPKLSTLLLQKNYELKIISEDLFINMPALKVLNLSYTAIERLPESLSDLESLVALVLSHCGYLSYIPSLENLRELMRLDLAYSGIRELPQGLEMLINLRWLNLEGTEELEMWSPSVIPQLTNLQSLFLWNHQSEVTAQEIQGLKMLESLSAYFHSREQFNACINLMLNKRSGFSNYYLQLGGDIVAGSGNVVYTDDKAVIIAGQIISSEAIRPLLPMDVKRLHILNCSMLECLCDDFSTIGNNGPQHLRICQISKCRNLMSLFCLSPSCFFCGSLQSLDLLKLEYLDSLQALHKFRFGAMPIMGPFSSLRYFSVQNCCKIEYLLTPEMTAQLIHLKLLVVKFCFSMKQIFSADEEEDGNHSEIINISGITLPSLESVILCSLPELTRVCIGVLTCESLQEFAITGCWSLKELPSLQPPFQIEVEQDKLFDQY